MVFETSASEESNIFHGPMALTKERDACGVGFIANTQSGGL
jgi:glutamate synthase (ferredoxin)